MGAVRLILRTSVAVASVALLAACGSSGSNGPTPTPTPTASAASDLQQLASTGLQQSYTAVYSLRATAPAGSAIVTVGRTPTAYRLNVQRGNSVAVLIHNTRGTYSCQKNLGHAAKCLLVAKPGSPVPALFDAGQRLWADYLTELSTNASAYLVTAAGTTPATATLPAGACFAVATGPTPPPKAVATGTYCLTDGGIPTKAAFTSGTFQLTQIRAAPRAQNLLPLAAPTPIPGLK
jgi:hypothetical protein